MLFLLASCGRLGFDERMVVGDGNQPDTPQACTGYTPWSVATIVPGINDPTDDAGPVLTRDGLTLYFQSFRDLTSLDIYIATRPSLAADFGTPIALAAGFVNTSANDRDAVLAAGDTRMYLSSDGSSTLAVVAVDSMFVATGSGDTFGPRASLAELGFDVYGPWVSADELEMYYSTSSGMLQRAVRSAPSDPWTPMGTSSLGLGGYPAFSADGHTIYFERAGTGVPQIFTATRAQLDDNFSAPTVVDLGMSFTNGVGDPFVTADNVELYFAGNAGLSNDIYRLTRACL